MKLRLTARRALRPRVLPLDAVRFLARALEAPAPPPVPEGMPRVLALAMLMKP